MLVDSQQSSLTKHEMQKDECARTTRANSASWIESAVSAVTHKSHSSNLPLADDFFQVPQLDPEKIDYLVSLAKRSTNEVVEYARQHDGPLQWIPLSNQGELQLFQGIDINSSDQRSLTYLRGTTRIYATMDEIADFFRLDTPNKCSGYTQTMGKDVLDWQTLCDLTDDHAKHYVGVHWMVIECPSKVARNRDFCLLECHDEFIDPISGKRGWVCSFHSINIPFCPELTDSHGFVRASMYRSGFVFTESADQRYVEATLLLHIDMKGHAPGWLESLTMKQRMNHMAQVNKYFQACRLLGGNILSDVDIPSSEHITSCQRCIRKFNILSRKFTCRKCARTICSACKVDFRLDSTGVKMNKVRICTECAHYVVCGADQSDRSGIHLNYDAFIPTESSNRRAMRRSSIRHQVDQLHETTRIDGLHHLGKYEDVKQDLHDDLSSWSSEHSHNESPVVPLTRTIPSPQARPPVPTVIPDAETDSNNEKSLSQERQAHKRMNMYPTAVVHTSTTVNSPRPSPASQPDESDDSPIVTQTCTCDNEHGDSSQTCGTDPSITLPVIQSDEAVDSTSSSDTLSINQPSLCGQTQWLEGDIEEVNRPLMYPCTSRKQAQPMYTHRSQRSVGVRGSLRRTLSDSCLDTRHSNDFRRKSHPTRTTHVAKSLTGEYSCESLPENLVSQMVAIRDVDVSQQVGLQEMVEIYKIENICTAEVLPSGADSNSLEAEDGSSCEVGGVPNTMIVSSQHYRDDLAHEHDASTTSNIVVSSHQMEATLSADEERSSLEGLAHEHDTSTTSKIVVSSHQMEATLSADEERSSIESGYTTLSDISLSRPNALMDNQDVFSLQDDAEVECCSDQGFYNTKCTTSLTCGTDIPHSVGPYLRSNVNEVVPDIDVDKDSFQADDSRVEYIDADLTESILRSPVSESSDLELLMNRSGMQDSPIPRSEVERFQALLLELMNEYATEDPSCTSEGLNGMMHHSTVNVPERFDMDKASKLNSQETQMFKMENMLQQLFL